MFLCEQGAANLTFDSVDETLKRIYDIEMVEQFSLVMLFGVQYFDFWPLFCNF